jgi:hypothetical protein
MSTINIRCKESVFHTFIENYLNGKHEKCGMFGESDGTSDTCMAEIKTWPSWKIVIAQFTPMDSIFYIFLIMEMTQIALAFEEYIDGK